MTTKRTTLEARQGEVSGAGRRILVGSLVLAAIVLLAGAFILGTI